MNARKSGVLERIGFFVGGYLMKSYIIALLSVFATQVAFAEAEVESRTFQESPGAGSMQFVEGPANATAQGSMGVGGAASGDVYSRIDALTQELSEMRGRLEEQEHQMQQLNKRQRDLYLDLDKRLGGSTFGPHADASDTEPKNTSSMASALASPSPVAAEENQPTGSEGLSNAALGTNRDEEMAYKAAYELMRVKKYTEATAAFNQMLENTPQGKFAANAHFWLGELAMLAGNNAEAEAQYNAVINHYPTHAKAPDALVKLGMLALDKKHNDVAKELFTRVINEFPDSAAAQVAAKQKLRLEKAGV